MLVSPDVPLDEPRLVLWGWFTRFDPLTDVHPAGRRVEHNRVVLEPPIAFDATWKRGYREPVAVDEALARRVDRDWGDYGITLPGSGS